MKSGIRGEQIKDESVASADLASGSVKAGEMHEQAISGQTLITSTDTTNDRLLIWDATDSALKQVSPGNLGLGGGGSVTGSNTQVQFNNGGSLAGATKLLYDESNGRLKIGDTNAPQNVLDVYGNISNDFVVVVQNDQSSGGHVLKLATDGNGNGSTILEMEDGDNDIVFKARADGRFGFGPSGVSSMGAGTFVVGIDGGHTSDIAISQRLQHLGDSNTYLDFPSADTFNLVAGGNSFLKYDSGNILINNANADVDMKVMADDGNVILITDASTNRVGIGTTTPQVTLHVHADSINDGAVTISQSDDSADASQLDLSKSRGSGASPAAVQNNDFIGQIRMLGYDGDSYDSFADIYAQAAGTISTTSHPTKVIIRTTQVSATSPAVAVTIDENQGMTVAGSIYGKMRHMTHHRYNDGSGTGKEYIPWAGTSEQPSPSYITMGVAPYNGRLAKVLVRSSKSGGIGSTVVGMHIGTDGTTTFNSTAEETVTVNMASANTTGTFNFTSANHFAAGDTIAVSIDPTSAHGNVNVTCVWEYDITA